MIPTLPWEPEFSTGASSTDYFIDAKLPFHPIPFLTIAPSVTWTSLLGDAKKSVDAVPDDSVFSGKIDNFYCGCPRPSVSDPGPLPPADRLRGGFFFPKSEPSVILQVESGALTNSITFRRESREI